MEEKKALSLLIDNDVITDWDPAEMARLAKDPGLPVWANVLVTPDHAARLVANTHRNRSAIKANVLRYAATMQRGDWQVNGETISFAPNGKNINGFNRLQACVDSGVPFMTVAAFNVNPDHYLTVDNGKARALSEVLFSENEDKHLAGPLALLWRLREEEGYAAKGEPLPKPRVNATNEQHIELLYSEPGMRDAVDVGKDTAKVPTLTRLNHSAIVVAAHLTALEDRVAADAFWPGLITGVGLNGGDPRLALRDWHAKNLKTDDVAGTDKTFIALMRVWNLYRAGERVNRTTFTYAKSEGLLVQDTTKAALKARRDAARKAARAARRTA